MTTHALTRRDALVVCGTAVLTAAAGPLGLIRPAFAAPKPGIAAPAFTLTDSNGKNHSQ